MQGVRAIAVGLVGEDVILDIEAKRRGDADQFGEDTQRVVADQARAGLGQLLAFRLLEGEDCQGQEGGDDTLAGVAIANVA